MRHRRSRRERPRPALALRMTPMIDVVFLLLAYFLLAAEFREPEGAVAASAAAPPAEGTPGAFRFPARPILIRVESTGSEPETYTIATEAPELSHAENAPSLRRAAAAALGPIFHAEQAFVIRCAPGTLWEHALAAAGALDAAGYTVVRFETVP